MLKASVISLVIFVAISDLEILFSRYTGFPPTYFNFYFAVLYDKINPKPPEMTDFDYYKNHVGSNTIRKIIQDTDLLPYQVQLRSFTSTIFLIVLAGGFLFLFIRTLRTKSLFPKYRKMLLPIFLLFFVWLQFLAGQSLSFSWVPSPDRNGNYTGQTAPYIREYYLCIPIRSKETSRLKNTKCDDGDIGSDSDVVRCFGFGPTREQELIFLKKIRLSDTDAMYLLDGIGFLKLKTKRVY